MLLVGYKKRNYQVGPQKTTLLNRDTMAPFSLMRISITEYGLLERWEKGNVRRAQPFLCVGEQGGKQIHSTLI